MPSARLERRHPVCDPHHGQRWGGAPGHAPGIHEASYSGRPWEGRSPVLIAQRPILSEDVVSENRSRFAIEPLEPGFGYTLGNSLRRTLLSSIPGAAVTSIKIDGVLHEFSSIQGVKEDVTDVNLNVKDIRLRSETNDPATMFLRSTGPVDVTAANILP